jgi:23S rRNA (guanosine2251-2'-O)-methyltransferase
LQNKDNVENRSEKNFIYGIRAVIEAIKEGKDIDKLMVQEGISGALFNELKTICKEHKILFQFVPVMKLDRITRANHQGVIAFVSEANFHDIENVLQGVFESGKVPLLLILDRITDVRNFGAICRTAECAGVQAVIIPSRGAAQVNADAVKTSAGAIHKLPLCRSNNLKETIYYLKDSGVQIVGCTEKTNHLYTTVDMTVPTAIIMGSEENGISPEYLKLCDKKAKLPLLGSIESLNVSVSAGIILYEAVRQRGIVEEA